MTAPFTIHADGSYTVVGRDGHTYRVWLQTAVLMPCPQCGWPSPHYCQRVSA